MTDQQIASQEVVYNEDQIKRAYHKIGLLPLLNHKENLSKNQIENNLLAQEFPKIDIPGIVDKLVAAKAIKKPIIRYPQSQHSPRLVHANYYAEFSPENAIGILFIVALIWLFSTAGVSHYFTTIIATIPSGLAVLLCVGLGLFYKKQCQFFIDSPSKLQILPPPNMAVLMHDVADKFDYLEIAGPGECFGIKKQALRDLIDPIIIGVKNDQRFYIAEWK